MASTSLTNENNLWNKVLEDVELSIGKGNFMTFFAGTTVCKVDGSKFYILVPEQSKKILLNEKFAPMVNNLLNKRTGSNFEVNFVVENDVASSEKKIPQVQPYFRGCSLKPEYTFDTLVVDYPNKEAADASKKVAENPGTFYTPLFIFGDSGLGKTHLLNAIGNYIKANFPDKKILSIQASDLINEYIDYVQTPIASRVGSLSEYINSFDVLLLDDVQMLKDKVKTLEFFFEIIQHYLQNNKQIVITSDRKPGELEGIDNRIVSRFMNGLTVSVKKPSIEMCKQIFIMKMSYLGISKEKIDDDAVTFVATYFKNNIRELNGAINRINFCKISNQKDYLDLSFVKTALSPILDIKENGSTITEQKILSAVAYYYNINIAQITGKLKTAQIATARHIAIYLIRTMLDTPLKKIGEIFSGRDHTTIMHSVQKVEKMLTTDKQTKVAIDELKAKISK